MRHVASFMAAALALLSPGPRAYAAVARSLSVESGVSTPPLAPPAGPPLSDLSVSLGAFDGLSPQISLAAPEAAMSETASPAAEPPARLAAQADALSLTGPAAVQTASVATDPFVVAVRKAVSETRSRRAAQEDERRERARRPADDRGTGASRREEPAAGRVSEEDREVLARARSGSPAALDVAQGFLARVFDGRFFSRSPAGLPLEKESLDRLSSVPRRTVALDKLLRADPLAARGAAERILARSSDPAEIRIHAVRVLEAMKPELAAPALLKVAKTNDNWYLRRLATKVLGDKASALAGAREQAVAVLAKIFADREENPSLRVMAQFALRAFGAEPGEVDWRPKPQSRGKRLFSRIFVRSPEKGFSSGRWADFKRFMRTFLKVGMWVALGGAVVFGIIFAFRHFSMESMSMVIMIMMLLMIVSSTLVSLMMMSGWSLRLTSRKVSDKSETTFADVAGIDDAVAELRELVDIIQHPKKYKDLGARIPKGVLLEGEPGTGKTLLARALAGEAGVPVLVASGADFVNTFVGRGAAEVRNLFKEARDNAPCIVFIDELDAVGGQRSSGAAHGGDREYGQTVNQLLTEMDGFEASAGIIVIAATNRADTLDSALKRPGRFDRLIHVPAPDVRGREAILQIHAGGARLAPDADLRFVAQRTPGLTGAFMENIINEAALLAARRGASAIHNEDLAEGVTRATMGIKTNRILSDDLRNRLAWHEAAHLLGMIYEGKKPNTATIIPRGSGALGFAESGSDEEAYLFTKSQLKKRLVTMLMGLAAEEVVFGEGSTGPSDDLMRSSDLAQRMVEEWGMSDRGLRYTAGARRGLSQATVKANDEAIEDILQSAMKTAKALIAKYRAGLDALARGLLEKETLIREEIEDIFRRATRAKPPAPPDPPTAS